LFPSIEAILILDKQNFQPNNLICQQPIKYMIIRLTYALMFSRILRKSSCRSRYCFVGHVETIMR